MFYRKVFARVKYVIDFDNTKKHLYLWLLAERLGKGAGEVYGRKCVVISTFFAYQLLDFILVF
jgi:hypothetical protein